MPYSEKCVPLIQYGLTKSHLINNGIVVCSSFIIHTPASIHKLKLFVIHKGLHLQLLINTQ